MTLGSVEFERASLKPWGSELEMDKLSASRQNPMDEESPALRMSASINRTRDPLSARSAARLRLNVLFPSRSPALVIKIVLGDRASRGFNKDVRRPRRA